MPDFRLMAVAGSPILHSKSPFLFNPSLLNSNSGYYTRVAADSAAEAIDLLRQLGLSGMNVTSPFKEEIMPFLDEVDAFAQKIGCVNCIVSKASKLFGYNTDAMGVLDSFIKNGISLKDKKAIVLGAGGAARAAVCALIEGRALVCIVNRTKSKADLLAKEFSCTSYDVRELPILLKEASIVVSSLASEHNLLQQEWLHPDLVLLDADYKTKKALGLALKQGAFGIPGEEWLINQAIHAYKHFHGQEPDENLMRRALYSGFSLKKDQIALVGFMGSGKSTIGKTLAEKLGWDFLDTDCLIEQKSGKRIPEIFRESGEEGFRKWETEILQEIKSNKKVVLATGGGVVLKEENRQILKQHFLPILLFVNADEAMKRIANSDRPLLNCGDILGKIQDLQTKRKDCYISASQLIVNTVHKSPESILEKIYDEVSRIF